MCQPCTTACTHTAQSCDTRVLIRSHMGSSRLAHGVGVISLPSRIARQEIIPSQESHGDNATSAYMMIIPSLSRWTTSDNIRHDCLPDSELVR